ncbi:MAG TPA: gliding motility-associated C-terminal domain-containing protein, partial [Flavisolibacter sp.]|nr:gliding motility-associated C-terminal domain-containing protein [Flavisolibacter sp.]
EWFVNGTSSATGASFAFVPPVAGNYTIRLALTTDKGCVSAGRDSVIQVNPLPELKFGMPENCVNDPISTFTDSSSVNNGSVASWLWNFGDGAATPANPNTSAVKNGTHKFSKAGDYNVSLAVTSDKSCVAAATRVFTINGSFPQSSFTISNAAPACVSSEVVVTSSPRVDVGKIVKTEIFWDDLNDPGNKTVDEEPEVGETYRKVYQPFFSPSSKTFTIRVRSYSGELCFDDSVVQVTLNAVPQITFSIPQKICGNEASFQLNAEVANVQGVGIYSGQGVSPAGVFSPAAAGEGLHVVRYTFTSSEGCVAFREDTIKVNPVPSVVAGPPSGIGVLEGGSVTIPATASGQGLTYLWSPPTWLNNPSALRPVATPLRDTIYSLTVTTAEGCSASSFVSVKVLKGITVPNVFTPNGDGINDRWEITYLESYAGAVIQLYNRNGQLIFQSKGYNKPWDGTINGKPVPFGTYYYVIDPKNGRKPITGFVDVLR